jgi:hypothetical protein
MSALSVQESELRQANRRWVNKTLAGIVRTIVVRNEAAPQKAAREWVEATLDSIAGKVAAG